MKIAIFGDKHIGARNGSKVFADYFLKSFDEFYFPDMEKEGIKVILQLGDLFDVRKTTANNILKEFKDRFFDKLLADGYDYRCLAGNHDMYWRDSLEVVTQNLVLNEYPNITTYTKPTTIEFGGTTFDMIPWLCLENSDDVYNFIKKSKSDICLGHFEFAGFSMYKGQTAHDGISTKEFEKYEQVWSGHYHTRSVNGNVTYTGTPWEITLQDAGDPRGYHIFDTETRVLEFRKNPFEIFVRVEYNDDLEQEFDYSIFTGKYVKVVVVKKNNVVQYDQFLVNVHNSNPVEVKCIEDMSEYSRSTIDETVNIEDTQSIVASYIDNLNLDVDKEKIKLYMRTLYTEALNVTE